MREAQTDKSLHNVDYPLVESRIFNEAFLSLTTTIVTVN